MKSKKTPKHNIAFIISSAFLCIACITLFVFIGVSNKTGNLVSSFDNLNTEKVQELADRTLLVVSDNFDSVVNNAENVEHSGNRYTLYYKDSETANKDYTSFKANENILFCEFNDVLTTSSTDTDIDAVIDDIRDLNEGYSELLNNVLLSNNTTFNKGSVVKIAVLDTGYNGQYFNSYNAVDKTTDVTDKNGHGTKMVRQIVQTIYSIDSSYDVSFEIIPIKVANTNGITTTEYILNALDWAYANGVNVINISMNSYKNAQSVLLENYIIKLSEQGTAVVVSAGNNSDDASNYSPSFIESAIVVGALESIGEDNNFIADFSNYGDTVDWYVCAESTSEASAIMSGYYAIAYATNKNIVDVVDYTIARTNDDNLMHHIFDESTDANSHIVDTALWWVSTTGTDAGNGASGGNNVNASGGYLPQKNGMIYNSASQSIVVVRYKGDADYDAAWGEYHVIGSTYYDIPTYTVWGRSAPLVNNNIGINDETYYYNIWSSKITWQTYSPSSYEEINSKNLTTDAYGLLRPDPTGGNPLIPLYAGKGSWEGGNSWENVFDAISTLGTKASNSNNETHRTITSGGNCYGSYNEWNPIFTYIEEQQGNVEFYVFTRRYKIFACKAYNSDKGWYQSSQFSYGYYWGTNALETMWNVGRYVGTVDTSIKYVKEDGTTGSKANECNINGNYIVSVSDTVGTIKGPEASKHKHVTEDEGNYPATCTTAGLTGHQVCTQELSNLEQCHFEIAGTVVPALGHSYTGSVTYSSYTYDATYHYRTKTTYCARYGQSGCESSAYTTETEKNAHSFGPWVTDSNATCIATGSKHRDCTVCGYRETATIPKSEHSSTPVPDVAATCTTAGLTGKTKCSICGTVLNAGTTTPALGHDMTKKTDDIYQSVSCTKDGYKYYMCARSGCGYAPKSRSNRTRAGVSRVVEKPGDWRQTNHKSQYKKAPCSISVIEQSAVFLQQSKYVI